MLMVKPWYANFNPSKIFNKISVWVWIPYLPLHLWVDSLLEEIVNELGEFLMVDDDSSDILHSTYACILVDMDLSNELPKKN